MNKYHLGPLVRQIRLAKGIGLNQFAWDSELNSANYCLFEQGKDRALRMPDKLYPIAEALGVSVPALLLLQEICWASKEIMDNPEILLAHLNRIHFEIERLAWRKPYSGGGVESHPQGALC